MGAVGQCFAFPSQSQQHPNQINNTGGSVWHSVKGFRNSPKGERLAGALTAVKGRAPILGGNFAVWLVQNNAREGALALTTINKRTGAVSFQCLTALLLRSGTRKTLGTPSCQAL